MTIVASILYLLVFFTNLLIFLLFFSIIEEFKKFIDGSNQFEKKFSKLISKRFQNHCQYGLHQDIYSLKICIITTVNPTRNKNMAKIISYDNDFHNKILAGIDKAEKCVCSTLGPSGRPVLLNDGRQTRLSKDGITVFNSIELEDPIENSAVMALREASANVAREAGDGTTTVTALGAAIFRNGLRYTMMNANPVQIKNGIEKAAKKVIEFIESKSISISSKEDIKKVCMISSNGDEKISEVIAEIFTKLGNDATVQVEDSGSEIGYSIVDGFQLPNTGYLSPFFCTSDDMTCNFTNAYVMIVDGKITNINTILPTLQAVMQEKVPLLIFADSIESEVMSMLVMNRIRTGFQVCCVKAPSYGENRKAIYRDIAMLTNGKVVSENTGISFEDTIPGEENCALGFAKSITVDKESTTIVGSGDNKEELDKYIAGLKAQIDASEDEFELKKMRERYARLTRGIAKVYAFAPSEIELQEQKDRIDDVRCAAHAALVGGIIPGGGSILLQAKKEFEKFPETLVGDEAIGARIMIDSLDAPLRKLLENAGLDPSYIVSKVLEISDIKNAGYDVLNKCVVDMIDSAIIDPTLVECSAIKNAVSVAGILLTSSACIIKKNDPVKPQMAPAM